MTFYLTSLNWTLKGSIYNTPAILIKGIIIPYSRISRFQS